MCRIHHYPERSGDNSQMAVVRLTESIQVGNIAWYLSGGLSDAERLEHARATNGAVLRGSQGHRVGAKLRKAGFDGRLWLDAAAWEASGEPPQDTLLGDRWRQLQEELDVEEVTSPGSFVAGSDLSGLSAALDSEGAWVAANGGRLSLTLGASWLTSGLPQLILWLGHVEGPLALAFADPNDPLGHPGAVEGLVELLRSVDNVAIWRCDLGAVGAVAYGASMGGIGTSTTVRHAVSPGQNAGGRRNDPSPSVFVAELLDFRRGSLLDEFPREASPTCDLVCCRGQQLRRLNDRHAAGEAGTHNRVAIGNVIAEILETPSEFRPEAFKAMCTAAEYAVAELASAARRPLKVRPQIRAWAQVC